MNKTAKIEITITEREQNTEISRGDYSWPEIIDALAIASAGLLQKVVKREKLEFATIAFYETVKTLTKDEEGYDFFQEVE